MRRILRAEHLVPVTGLVIFLLVFVGVPERPCTARAACTPDVPSWVALGLLLAPMIMVYVHRWAAAWATVACAVSWLLIDRYPGDDLGPAVLLPWAYAAVGLGAARRGTDRVERVAPRATVPAPARLPHVGGRYLLLAAATFAAAAALGGWVLWRQDAAERQPGSTRLAGGVDHHGLWQLRSEPYDVTPLVTFVVVAAGLGVALLAVTGRRRHDLRALFATPQALRPVRVVDDYGYVHVLVPAGDGRTAVEFGVYVDEPDPPAPYDDEDAEPVTAPALLYGEPHPGRWCAVQVNGRIRVPVAPVGETAEVPYDPEHHLPREVADDDAQLVDEAELTDADRAARPGDVREHRVTPLRRWFEAVAIGVGVSLATAQAVHQADGWRGWTAVATVAVAAALAYEFGWRTQLRPRLLWDVGGLAALTFRGRDRAMWTADSAVVHDGDGTVVVTAGDLVLVVDAPAPWPPWAAQRTAGQLVAGLRDARRQALDTAAVPAPPDLAEPGRPLLLYLLWAATVAAAIAIAGR